MRKFRNGLIIIAVIAIIATAAVGTYAYFSDQGSVAVTAQAGTLDLRINGSNATQAVSLSNMKPGDERDATWTLKNVGSVDGIITGGAFTATQSGGADNTGNLSEVLKVQVYIDGVPAWSDPKTLSTYLTGATGSDTFDLDKALNAGASCTVLVRFTWPTGDSAAQNELDNKAQGDKLEVSATFDLIQAH